MEVNFLLEQVVDAPFRPQLEQLLNVLSIEALTDVLANGPGEWWIERGNGLEPLPQIHLPTDNFERLVRFLISLGDRHLDLITPVTDVSISPKSLPPLQQLGISRLRVHAVLKSELSETTLLSVRVHREAALLLEDLQALGMLNPLQRGLVQKIIDQRSNFIISGAAGSGKTTLLRAILAESPNLRTVAVEDAAELVPSPGHVIGMQSRQANTEGAGAIGVAELARQALRMRPDRLVIGEVRGTEVEVLLQAMNTGHRGSAGTIHANSANEVYPRLRLLALSTGLTDEAFAATCTAIDFVIHLDNRSGVRTVASIGELCH